MQIAYFAGGCFWCVEAVFQRIDGVLEVKSGYCNGSTINPTYPQICTGETGHAEVVEVKFDESMISFNDLLKVFFTTHDPTTLNQQGNDRGTQYRSAVFYINEAQKNQAESMIKELGEQVVTEVTKLDTFYPAEDYHQNYFNNNPNQPYCVGLIAPKLAKYFNL